MKHGKRIFLIFAVLASALIVAGCGGGSDDGGTTTTEVSSAQEGQQASSSTVQAVTMAEGSFSTFQGLSGVSSEVTGAPALPAVKFGDSLGSNDIVETAARLTGKLSTSSAVKAAAAAFKKARGLAPMNITITGIQCDVSGTMDINGTIDEAAGTASATITFNQCRDYESLTDGTMSMEVTPTSVSVTANVDRDEFVNDVLTVSLTMTNLTFSQTFTAGATANSGTFTISASGSIHVVNHVDNEEGTITYSGFGQTVTADLDASDLGTVSITTNGGISVSFTDNSGTYTLSVTYGNLVLSVTFTASYSEFSVNGSVGFNFEPNNFCFEGTYVISTVTPVREVNDQTVAGEIHINDNVVIVFNADGSVTVTVSGTVEDFLSIDELEGVCEFVVLS